MSTDAADLLALSRQLHDIELPPPPLSWPPAPGWWALAALAVALLLFALYGIWRRTRPRRAALEELARLQQRFAADADAAALAMGLSVLLRRVALARDGRERVAGLSGEDWLAYLDRGAEEQPFSTGPGRLLLTLPYAPRTAAADLTTLLALVRQWLRRHTR